MTQCEVKMLMKRSNGFADTKKLNELQGSNDDTRMPNFEGITNPNKGSIT